MDLVEDRERLRTGPEKKGDDGIEEYRGEQERHSIDGLPGLAA